MYKLFPSWLAPWFGLPIDGVLYGSEINILSAETLESFGSDHWPVLIHFEIDDAGEPLSASLEANPGD